MAEILKIREITIDTMQHKEFNVKEEELKLIRFYQNDLNSAKLLINVTHDKVVTDFSSATSVQIAFLKPDCKRVFQDVQNVNQMQGKYYVVLSTQTLIAYGNVIAQLRFTFPNNKVIETCKFAFTVDESIMSDDAMKSTNEFPVIQKAIEAGKKLEGVDIDGIIAAGELAKGAVKKTGDTMTGNLIMERGKGERAFEFFSEGNRSAKLADDENNIFLHDVKNNKVIWQYRKGIGDFIVNSSTNLLKKTGDIMSGSMTMDVTTGQKRFVWAGNNINTGFNASDDPVSQNFSMVDYKNNRTIWTYEPLTNSFNFRGDMNVPWVRKTGDTLTGNLSLDRPNENTFRQFLLRTNNAIDAWFGLTGNNSLQFYDQKNLRQILDYNFGTQTFHINAPKITTAKDGRANLTLTADALAVDSNNPPIAFRRGNTVTFRCYMQRKVGSASNLMTVLPVDMRPLATTFINALAHDGTVCRVTIGVDGNVFIGNSGNTSTEGKQLAENITYVVD